VFKELPLNAAYGLHTTHECINCGTVFIDGSAAITTAIFEAPDDETQDGD
jgi:hypothetical protein